MKTFNAPGTSITLDRVCHKLKQDANIIPVQYTITWYVSTYTTKYEQSQGGAAESKFDDSLFIDRRIEKNLLY